MKLGFIAGGFKPFTKGHYFLVEQASKKCDVVYLFVSTGDRMRKGEMPLLWSSMEKVWKRYLLPSMPKNVTVEFVSNPTTAIFEQIEKDKDSAEMVYIFGDAVDAPKTFSQKTLAKYFPELVEANRIQVQAFDRTANVNISGTKMREFLATGNRKSFIENLPAPVQKDGEQIFNILIPKKVTEMKITNTQLNQLVESLVKEQLEERQTASRRECFNLVEHLKQALREGDWNASKVLCTELMKKLEGF
jgi:cytidyltransferase-like protein